jgi:hypothetical protein
MEKRPIDPIEAQAIIEEIDSLDLNYVAFEKLNSCLAALLRGYRYIIPWFIPGLRLYRVRIYQRPENIHEISYPPKSTVHRLGRINNIGEAIFYCSTVKNAILFELSPKALDQIVISEWITTDKLAVSPIGFTQKALQKLKSDKDITNWDITNYPLEVDAGNRLVHEFLANCITERVLPGEEYKYKLTIALARILLATDFVHGVAYPTVSMRGNGINLAIKTDFVDRALKFVSAEFLEVTKVDNSEFSLKKLYSADKIENNRIVWHAEPLSWKLEPSRMIRVTVENGKWIARDEKGNLVEPE